MPKSFALNIVCHIQNHPILIINLGKKQNVRPHWLIHSFLSFYQHSFDL